MGGRKVPEGMCLGKDKVSPSLRNANQVHRRNASTRQNRNKASSVSILTGRCRLIRHVFKPRNGEGGDWSFRPGNLQNSPVGRLGLLEYGECHPTANRYNANTLPKQLGL